MMIIIHASRGEIRGRTTGILEGLSKYHGLREITLLQPMDAPQGRDLEKSAQKAAWIAMLLEPHVEMLVKAATEGRILVAGKFAWNMVRRASPALQTLLSSRRVVHPCHWRNRRLERILAKLQEVLRVSAPLPDQLATYVVQAHREALRDRWARMSPEEKMLYRQRKVALYVALPQDEKDRRARVSQTVTAQYWERTSATLKLLRGQARLAWRRSKEGRSAWTTALRAARAAMARVRKARREGCAARMTPERQRALGLKRKASWCEEKRRAAARRQRMRNAGTPEVALTALCKARATRMRNIEAVSKQRLPTCAWKLLETVRTLMQRPEAGELLNKQERRTLRERGSFYQDLAAEGSIALEQEALDLLARGIAASQDEASSSKSSKLRVYQAQQRAHRETDDALSPAQITCLLNFT